ncbi:MAG: peptide ABC transporter substrate-binding protein, partial [Legionellales bacterium]|nr:peptide ABC transporter substrate-binding protein [Legionellales bacterium]
GIDQKTGKHLVLYLDNTGTGPNAKAQTNWYRKQFKKLGIDLYVRNTSWNRFQEKLRNGSTQMFTLGWNADYPDPENFLFLLYGPNSKLKSEGENVSNFQSEEYDRLFEQMKNLPNNDERAAIINKMVAILQEQSPWVWGFFHKTFILGHTWNGPNKINPIANNGAKYQSVDAKLRYRQQQEWNVPSKNIIGLTVLALLALILPGLISYRKRTQTNQVNRF